MIGTPFENWTAEHSENLGDRYLTARELRVRTQRAARLSRERYRSRGALLRTLLKLDEQAVERAKRVEADALAALEASPVDRWELLDGVSIVRVSA